jgi:protein SCO1/2
LKPSRTLEAVLAKRLSRLSAPALLGAFALALGLCSCGGSAPAHTATVSDSLGGFDGAALPAGESAHDFSLTDQYGARVSLARYRGRVVMLSFLYPSCGSACVLIAEQIRGALDELESPVPVLIVSAEPAADNPAGVRRFLAQVSLTGRALYLGGTRAQLQPIWRAYHVQPASAGAAAFSNYAGVILLDRAGVERVLFEQEELSPEALTHDVRKLQRE